MIRATTPAKRAKQLGLDNLQSLIDHTKIDRVRMGRWVNDKPEVFDLMVFGFIKHKVSLTLDVKVQAI